QSVSSAITRRSPLWRPIPRQLTMPPAPVRMKAKVCMVGDAAVGKSSLVRRFLTDEFSDAYVATLGAKVLAKDVRVSLPDGETVEARLTVWDIMGGDEPPRRAGGRVLPRDPGDRRGLRPHRYSTFERLPIWLGAVKRV